MSRRTGKTHTDAWMTRATIISVMELATAAKSDPSVSPQRHDEQSLLTVHVAESAMMGVKMPPQ